MGQRLVVSEFPNDNPELHDGLVWACPTPCAPALPTLRLRPSAPVRVLQPDWEHVREPDVTVESARPRDEVEVAGEVTLEAETAPVETVPNERAPSGFEAFVAALSAILAERGATRAAANVGALFGQARLARDAFDAETQKALVAGGMLDAKSARPTPEFSVLASAWRDALDGNAGDLSACGSATLDVFGAELLATLLGSPRGADELRRALRQRGVAAFGMLAAA